MQPLIYSYFTLFSLLTFLSTELVAGKSLSEQLAELQKDDLNKINRTMITTSFESSDDENKDRDEIFYNQYQKEDPLQKILPKVRFNCTGRPESYYADPDFNCEVFHYCKTNGFRFTFICPPKSLFDQKHMTCDYDKPKEEICQSSNSSNSDNHSSKRINPQWLTGEEDYSKDIASVNSVNHFVRRYPEDDTSIDSQAQPVSKFTQYSNHNEPKVYEDPKSVTDDSKSYSTYDYTESSLYSDPEDEKTTLDETYSSSDSYDQGGVTLEDGANSNGFKPMFNEQGAKMYTTSSPSVLEIKAESVQPFQLSTPLSISTSHFSTSQPIFFTPSSNNQKFEPLVDKPVKTLDVSASRENAKTAKPKAQLTTFDDSPKDSIQDSEHDFNSTHPNLSVSNEKSNNEQQSHYNQFVNSRNTFTPIYSNSNSNVYSPSVQYANNKQNYPYNYFNQQHSNNSPNFNYDYKRYNNGPQHPNFYQNFNHDQGLNSRPFVHYNEPNRTPQQNNFNHNGPDYHGPSNNGPLYSGPPRNGPSHNGPEHHRTPFNNPEFHGPHYNSLENHGQSQNGPEFYNQPYNSNDYYRQHYNNNPEHHRPHYNGPENHGSRYNNMEFQGSHHHVHEHDGPYHNNPEYQGPPQNGQNKPDFYFNKYKQEGPFGPNHLNGPRPHDHSNYPYKSNRITGYSDEEDHKYPDFFYGLPRISGQNGPPSKYDLLMSQTIAAHSTPIPYTMPFEGRPYLSPQHTFPFLTWLRFRNVDGLPQGGFMTSASNNEHRLTFTPLIEPSPSIPQPRRIPFLSSLSKLFYPNSFSKPNYIPFYQLYPKSFEPLEYPTLAAILRAARSPLSAINFAQNPRLVPLYADSSSSVLPSPIYDSVNNHTWNDNFASPSHYSSIIRPSFIRFRSQFPYSEFSARSGNITAEKKSDVNVSSVNRSFETVNQVNSTWKPVTNQPKRSKRSVRTFKKRIFSASPAYFTLNDFSFLTGYNKMLIHPLSLASSIGPTYALPSIRSTTITSPHIRKPYNYRYFKSPYFANYGYPFPLNLNLYPMFDTSYSSLINPFNLLSSSNFKNKFTVKTRYVPTFGKTTFFDPEFGPISIDINELSDFGSTSSSELPNEEYSNDLEEEPRFKPISLHKSGSKRPPNRNKIPGSDTDFKTWSYLLKDGKNDEKTSKQKDFTKWTKSNYYTNINRPTDYSNNIDGHNRENENTNPEPKKLYAHNHPHISYLIPPYDKSNIKESNLESNQEDNYVHAEGLNSPHLNNYKNNSYNNYDLGSINIEHFPQPPYSNQHLPPEGLSYQPAPNYYSNKQYLNNSGQYELHYTSNPTNNLDDGFIKSTPPTSTFVYTSINAPKDQNENTNEHLKIQKLTSIKKVKPEMIKAVYKYKPSAYARKPELVYTSTTPNYFEWSTTVTTSTPASAEMTSAYNLNSYGTRLSSINKNPVVTMKASYSMIAHSQSSPQPPQPPQPLQPLPPLSSPSSSSAYSLSSSSLPSSPLSSSSLYSSSSSSLLSSLSSPFNTNESKKQVEMNIAKLINFKKEKESQPPIGSNHQTVSKPSAYASRNLKSKIRYQGADVYKLSAYRSPTSASFPAPISTTTATNTKAPSSFDIGLNRNIKSFSSHSSSQTINSLLVNTSEVTTVTPLATSTSALSTSQTNLPQSNSNTQNKSRLNLFESRYRSLRTNLKSTNNKFEKEE